MEDIFQRTRMLLGPEAMEILRHSHVAVFGLGGVGSYAAEALVRSAVGSFTLVDSDTVQPSNINRQIIALTDTVGALKTAVESERMQRINPQVCVQTHPIFFTQESADDIAWDTLDYVVDAIDTVTSKLVLIETCVRRHIPIISSMGTGNKLDPTKLTVTDIYSTSTDPLARVMRRELRRRGVQSLKVVCSTEEPRTPREEVPAEGKKRPPGSTAFVPAAAGLILASQVVCDLIGVR